LDVGRNPLRDWFVRKQSVGLGEIRTVTWLTDVDEAVPVKSDADRDLREPIAVGFGQAYPDAGLSALRVIHLHIVQDDTDRNAGAKGGRVCCVSPRQQADRHAARVSKRINLGSLRFACSGTP
jgi:hypothetical protein